MDNIPKNFPQILFCFFSAHNTHILFSSFIFKILDFGCFDRPNFKIQDNKIYFHKNKFLFAKPLSSLFVQKKFQNVMSI